MNFNGPAKRIDDIDLPRIAADIGCGEDELHALIDVESSGYGFDKQGRPKCLFEPHVFWRNLPAGLRPKAEAQGIAYRNWRPGNYPPDSYPRLTEAMKLDEAAALKAASWGLPQILGENYRQAGYDSVQAMVTDFTLDEDRHLQAMVNFLKANKITEPLRNHDWTTVARLYNGPQYATNNYHVRLAQAFARWQQIKDTPWDGTTPAKPPALTPAQPEPDTVEHGWFDRFLGWIGKGKRT